MSDVVKPTRHTDEEIAALKAEWDAATKALRESEDRRDFARDAYNDACCANLLADFIDQGGVVGVTRVRREWMGDPDMRAGPFVVIGAQSAALLLAPITKAGKPHASRRRVSTRVFILPEDQHEARHDPR